MELLHAEPCQIQLFQKKRKTRIWSGEVIVWMIFFFFPLETDCTILFSLSCNSCFSNDFPSHDEDVRIEWLLSEPLLVSLGVPQGCVLGPGTFYPWPSSNAAITPGISYMSNPIFLMQFRQFKDKRCVNLLREENICTSSLKWQQLNNEATQVDLLQTMQTQ